MTALSDARSIGEATSRVRTTRLVAEAIYRHALDRPMDEHTGELGGNEPGAPSTWNFSIDVARSWERAFFESQLPWTRKIALRSAMVMSPDRGGVFDMLPRLVRHGLGGTAGSGR